AQAAINELNGAEVDGRNLVVNESRPKEGGSGGGGGYKKNFGGGGSGGGGGFRGGDWAEPIAFAGSVGTNQVELAGSFELGGELVGVAVVVVGEGTLEVVG
ncbi:MAG: hypothetical protein Q9224_007633, partial [Gallowayella concinna]